MTPITSPLGPANHLATLGPAPGAAAGAMLQGPRAEEGGANDELRQRFTQFVGETFFGQMIKAMRSTCGKPAYFHGGRGEEVFRGQLDLTLAEHMSEASASRFAEPMFDRQFPHLAKRPASGPQLHATQTSSAQVRPPHAADGGLAQLETLSRR